MTPRAILAYVRKHPDSTCAEIARAFDTKPAFVSALLRELRTANKVRSTGNTRGTKWAATT